MKLVLSNYLLNLWILKHRTAFTLAYLIVLPSTSWERKYHGVLLHEHLCPSAFREIEMARHMLLHWHFCNDKDMYLLYLSSKKIPGRSEEWYTSISTSGLEEKLDLCSYQSTKVQCWFSENSFFILFNWEL